MSGKTAGISRRSALSALSAGAAIAAWGAAAGVAGRAQAALADGVFAASHPALIPGSPDDQSRQMIRALEEATTEGRPLFLPPGRYEIADVTLPATTHLIGVPGETHLAFRGGPFMLRTRGAKRLRLDGVTLDGQALPLEARALLDAEDVADVAIDDCRIMASGNSGVTLRDCAGRVTQSAFLDAADVGVDVDQSRGMKVTGNRIADCGNTGILIQRDSEATDNSIVSGNRVERIRADSGGTGQNGNGINLDKANGVIVSDNRIDDCAFSAIRCFSSDGLAITGNVATRLREMAFYVEFAFEGAVVANNLIDGAVGGISLTNFFEHGGRLGTISGNVVRNIVGGPAYPDGNLQIGSGIAAEADIAITGNVVEDAVWGVGLGWGPHLRNVTASGNVIRRTNIGIAVSVVEGAGPALIANNLIADTAQGAILGMRWTDVATGELGEGGEAVPGVSVVGNRVG